MKIDKNKSFLNFFTDCLVDLSNHNIKVVLTNKPTINISFDNTTAKGSWDDSSDLKNPILTCSVFGEPEYWITTFAHEYCHFLQWKDKNHIWKKYDKLDGNILSNAVNNKPISKNLLEYSLNCVRDLELDCEKRTVQLFKLKKLPIDLDEYIREANVYVHYYNYLKISRSWYKNNQQAPHEVNDIKKLALNKFYSSYECIPSELLNAFIRFYPPEKSRVF